ncbi:MAG: phenylacetate--CoA ligase family protein [Candidatus Aminicenantes bacterium]|nr:phenylacetate--CoA ligase family protein [Candidatus Aminicenantes bacterium]
MRSAFVRRVLYPLQQTLQGRNFLGLLEEWSEIQYRPPDELRERQEEKLRSLFLHARRHVPHYAEKCRFLGLGPDDIRGLDDLPKLPVLSREDVRSNFPLRITADNVPRRRRVPDRTSGSTGEPLIFYRDKAARDAALASFLLFDAWAGIRPGDRSVHVGAPQPFKLNSKLSAVLRGHTDLGVFSLDDGNTEALLAKLVKIKPDLIEGYASVLFRVALAALKRDVRPKPRAVIATSDTLPAHEPVEDAFGCRVFNRYGNREICGALAQNCPDGRGLHINTELCVLEVVDEHNLPVPAGRSGRVLVTDLANRVMPLIRYDTGDRAAAGGTCSCGRGFPLVSAVEGRSTEFLISPRGGRVSPVSLGHFLFVSRPYAGSVRVFQAEQRDAERVVFRFVPMGRASESLKQDLLRDLQEFMGRDVEVRIEFVGDIPAGPGGKRSVIVSSIAPRFP